MFCSNYELLGERGSNVFVCHSRVLNCMVYEKDPIGTVAVGRAAETTTFKRLRLRLRPENIDSDSASTPDQQEAIHPKRSNMMWQFS